MRIALPHHSFQRPPSSAASKDLPECSPLGGGPAHDKHVYASNSMLLSLLVFIVIASTASPKCLQQSSTVDSISAGPLSCPLQDGKIISLILKACPTTP